MTFVPPEFPDDFNMADWFLFSNIDAGRGDKTVIYFEAREISYRDVAEKVMQVARNLVADGLLPEQRVLVCMQDRPEFAYAWFGALKAGTMVDHPALRRARCALIAAALPARGCDRQGALMPG